MLVGGVFVKTHYGLQGHIQLLEGTASDDLIHPHVPALSIEQKFPSLIQSVPLEQVKIVEYFPHAEENYQPLHPLEEWIAYDRGFQGYTVQVPDEIALQTALKAHLDQNLPISPPLELMRHSADQILPYLKAWHEAGTWLFDQPYSRVDWEKVPESTQNALFWIAEIFDEDHFIKRLEDKKWPLLESLKTLPREEQYALWMAQIYTIKDQLPSFEKKTSPRMLSAYLRLYGIHYSIIPKPLKEMPLTHTIIPKSAPFKKEERTPAITIDFKGEKISLLFNSPLKWPSKGGNFLFRFQPHREKIPYLIRLHQAVNIKQPGSDQTASYECTLTLIDKRTGNKTPCFLSMNKPYETMDGYRFYLAGMGKVDTYGVKSVQLVINRDPAKMLLTYPGGFLVTLGTLLLFFKKKDTKG